MEPTLKNKKIIITRSYEQIDDFSDRIRERGGIPFLMPGIKTTPFHDNPELIAAIDSINDFDWIVFTSTNAVRYFFQLTGEKGIKKINAKIATVGPSTAKYVEKLGYRVHAMPDEYLAENLKASMGKIKGKKILLPQANIARKVLIEILRQNGAEVKDVILYKTEKLNLNEEQKKLIQTEGIHYITFASSSAANAFLSSLGENYDMNNSKIVCIGPRTAQTVSELGYTPDIIASPYTVDGMIKAMEEDCK